MANSNKGILISAITNKLADENKKRNADLCKQNLYSDQKPFDHGETMLNLAFMQDKEFNEIVALVL